MKIKKWILKLSLMDINELLAMIVIALGGACIIFGVTKALFEAAK